MSSRRASHSSRSSQSKQSKSARLSSNSTSKTSYTNKTRSSAYDKNFERYIINKKIFLKGYEYPDDCPTPEANNEDELEESLARSRPSLSPSRFTNKDFQRFVRDNDRVYEGLVISVGITAPPLVGGKAEAIFRHTA